MLLSLLNFLEHDGEVALAKILLLLIFLLLSAKNSLRWIMIYDIRQSIEF